MSITFLRKFENQMFLILDIVRLETKLITIIKPNLSWITFPPIPSIFFLFSSSLSTPSVTDKEKKITYEGRGLHIVYKENPRYEIRSYIYNLHEPLKHAMVVIHLSIVLKKHYLFNLKINYFRLKAQLNEQSYFVVQTYKKNLYKV